jgi:hypothetical protein
MESFMYSGYDFVVESTENKTIEPYFKHMTGFVILSPVEDAA